MNGPQADEGDSGTGRHSNLPEWIHELLPEIQAEMRRLANHHLRRQHQEAWIQPSSVVQDAWVKLLESRRVELKNKDHVVAVLANCLRETLVDRIRQERTLKRGGGHRRIELSEEFAGSADSSIDLVALGDALDELERRDPYLARVATLRLFGGLTLKQVASVLGICERTAETDWHFAYVWLKKQLAEGESHES